MMDREDEDFGEGYIAESHPLRPTHLTVPLGGRSDSRAPSISSSVSDLDVPIYSRETTIPLSARKVTREAKHVSSPKESREKRKALKSPPPPLPPPPPPSGRNEQTNKGDNNRSSLNIRKQQSTMLVDGDTKYNRCRRVTAVTESRARERKRE